MPASNIPWVLLHKDGSVTIDGEFTDIDKYDVALLHVWLAATGDNGQKGAGLAIDCCQKQKNVRLKPPKFTLTKMLGAGPKGVPDAKFGEGQATVTGLTVLTPKPRYAKDLQAEVIQWGRTLCLETDKKK
jgi:hypothetical protein